MQKFQSHNGLILISILIYIIMHIIHISIPQWSDFNTSSKTYIHRAFFISIPQWSDFNDTRILESQIKYFRISIPQWSDFNYISYDRATPKYNWFQSHNGLILIEYYKNGFFYYKNISIPQWSDFNLIIFDFQRLPHQHFNPTMVWF